MNEGPIQLHPEAQRLACENDLLREELTALLTQVDTLLGTAKPNLLALYQTKIGLWEMRLLQAQCETARQRRKLELDQASINRGVPPAPSEIEATLELEFLAWQQKLREAAERVQTAEQRLKHLLSPTEDRELKKRYHALVRRLHPDVNPNLTDEQRRLWHRVQAAYEAGDFTELPVGVARGERRCRAGADKDAGVTAGRSSRAAKTDRCTVAAN